MFNTSAEAQPYPPTLNRVAAFSIPEILKPEFATDALPSPNAHDLRQVRVAKWARFGIVAAMVNAQGEILMLEHRASDKTTAGALGPLAETAQLAGDGNDMQVETTAHTLARGIYEELGLADPNALALQSQKMGAWALGRWPVGGRYANEYALGVCPVVHLSETGSQQLLDTFQPTPEIANARFMAPDAIFAEQAVRPGTHAWLGDITASGLLVPDPQELSMLHLPDPARLPGGIDIKFHGITNL